MVTGCEKVGGPFQSSGKNFTPIPVPAIFTSAAHPALPQMWKSAGRILTSPTVMMITFAGDGFAATLNTFVGKFVSSAEWTAMSSEYGVGATAAATPVSLAGAPGAALTDSQVQTLLSTQLNLGGQPLGVPSSSTIYTIYFPQATTITAADGSSKSCVVFNGYHSSYHDAGSGLKIAYSVIAHCAGDSADNATTTISHETLEAATDPDGDGNNGVSGDFAIWPALFGTELADLCEGFTDSVYTPSSIGNSIQKTWSNAAAMGSGDPCVPSVGEIYFNSIPVLTDNVKFTNPKTLVTEFTRGVSIPVAGSKTVALELYSNVQTAPWSVVPLEVTTDNTSHGTFSQDLSTGSNGSTIRLTLHINAHDPGYKANIFMIQSTLGSAKKFYPFVVGDPW